LALRRDQLEEASRHQQTSDSTSRMSGNDVNICCMRILLEMTIHTTLVNLTEVLIKAVIFHLPNKRSFKS
jgi:hypothetical protein